MNKQEFIDKLKQHGAWCTECHDINGKKDRYVKATKVRGLLEQLDEPQAEKVEVPSMIAKFINEKSDPIFEICAWSDYYGSDGRTCDDPDLSVVLDWYGSNTKEFYEAFVNGYTIKPKRWVVRNTDGDTCYLKRFRIGEDCIDGESSGWVGERSWAFTFDDKAKAEAVATLVEGRVEEV